MPIDLSFIARQLERVIAEQASMRDEMRVQLAIIMRLDTTLAAVLHELRETHTQIARINDRILKLEEVQQ
jgi:hypothetical protein